MPPETQPFDVVEMLTDEDTIAAYLEEAFETGDTSFIASAIGDVVRARNLTATAKEAGVARDTLYRAFTPGGNPTLETIVSVIKPVAMS